MQLSPPPTVSHTRWFLYWFFFASTRRRENSSSPCAIQRARKDEPSRCMSVRGLSFSSTCPRSMTRTRSLSVSSPRRRYINSLSHDCCQAVSNDEHSRVGKALADRGCDFGVHPVGQQATRCLSPLRFQTYSKSTEDVASSITRILERLSRARARHRSCLCP